MAYALLIDDDDALRESLAAMADNAGLRLDTAATWDDGLAAFHVLSPELVICDYHLPGSRNGLKLLAELRQYRPSVRLVLLSGYLDTASAARVEALGLVQRAVVKGTPTAADVILEEIAHSAEVTSDEPQDWRAYAQAHVAAAEVAEEQLDALDAILRERTERR